MTEVIKVIEKMTEKPYLLDMGANKIASMLKVSPDSVREAKKCIRRDRIVREIPGNKKEIGSAPRILLLDIETAPVRAFVWRLWKQNVFLDQIISDWFMLTWAAKWLLDEGIMSNKLTPEEARTENDFRIVENLWHLLNQADIVIAHNGERFDIPKIKSRFVLYGLPPTTFYQQIDTMKVAKREFGFSSNKLEALARTFGLEGKVNTDFTLWSSCLDGDPTALSYMEIYNKKDVSLLEEVYLILRPYIKAHPNYNLFIDSDEPVCPHCGHKELVFAGYYYFTPTGKYKNFRCVSCGALARERHSVYKNSKSILVSNGK